MEEQRTTQAPTTCTACCYWSPQDQAETLGTCHHTWSDRLGERTSFLDTCRHGTPTAHDPTLDDRCHAAYTYSR